MAEFGTIVFDKLIYDLCKNGWRPDLRGEDTDPLELTNYFGVKNDILRIVDPSVLENSIEVVERMKPNTQYRDFMDNRIDNFKNALLLLFLVAAREEIVTREKEHKSVLDRFESEIKNLSELIKEGEVTGQSENEINILKKKRLIFRKIRYNILTDQAPSVPVTVKIHFADNLIHPEGENPDPEPGKGKKKGKEEFELTPEEVKLIIAQVNTMLDSGKFDESDFEPLFGISPENVEVNGESSDNIFPGFGDNTYLLYCGD